MVTIILMWTDTLNLAINTTILTCERHHSSQDAKAHLQSPGSLVMLRSTNVVVHRFGPLVVMICLCMMIA